MLHLPGSLANLCKSFFPQDSTARKGHFPHLFNTPENASYVGVIPDLKYFDLVFMAKDDRQVREFEEWHAAQRARGPVWNFKTELLEYCVQDVRMLAKLVAEFHEINTKKFDISPWFHATAPAYYHEVVKRRVSKGYELPDPQDEEAYNTAVAKVADKSGWCVMRDAEHWFARGALRGGRTEVRKVYDTISDEDWARGVRFAYVDVVSLYPSVQVMNDYPLGSPIIKVYDYACYPCYLHARPSDGNYVPAHCKCHIESRKHLVDTVLDICDLTARVPTVEQILADDSFFGIVCASMTPPNNLFHPVLVTYDYEAQKCVASLKPFVYERFTSVEFKKALRMGYRLDKLHRLDQYNYGPGLWNDFIMDLVILKMENSGAAPASLLEREKIITDYEDAFGCGEAVRSSMPNWAKNPAKRQTFKIGLNSGWGKHAQRVNMPDLKIIGEKEFEAQDAIMRNISEQRIKCLSYERIGGKIVTRTTRNGKTAKPNYHGEYLPVGVFVPAYGRLVLYEQLEKLGDRVLYHDTDSIIYRYDPDLPFNVKTGTVLGQWDEEDFGPKNGGIREFVATGPKSYGLKADNGVSYIKVKGLSLKNSHKGLLNFDVMKRMVLGFVEDNDTSMYVAIPQFTFSWGLSDRTPMITRPMNKIFAFNTGDLKGVLVGKTLFPYGHIEAVEEEEGE